MAPPITIVCPRGHNDWYIHYGKTITKRCRTCTRERKSQMTREEYLNQPLSELCPLGHNRWTTRKSGPRKGDRYCMECERERSAKDKGKYQRNWNVNATTRRHKRMFVILAYGGRCACCGESRYEFLTIDHIDNDGAEHRRKEGISSGGSIVNWLINNDFPAGFQILCWNCNAVKQYCGYCPHQEAEL